MSPVIRVSGIAIPRSVCEALLRRIATDEFTAANLVDLALPLLRETGGPVSLCHVVVERIISRERRAGRIAKRDVRGPRGAGVWGPVAA